MDSYSWEHRSPVGTSRAWTEGGTGVTGTSVTSTIAGLVTTATEFRVRGVNSAGAGDPSATVVLAAKPTTVTGLDADRREVLGLPDGTVRLRWVRPVADGIDNGIDDLTGYDYERALAGSNSFGPTCRTRLSRTWSPRTTPPPDAQRVNIEELEAEAGGRG